MVINNGCSILKWRVQTPCTTMVCAGTIDHHDLMRCNGLGSHHAAMHHMEMLSLKAPSIINMKGIWNQLVVQLTSVLAQPWKRLLDVHKSIFINWNSWTFTGSHWQCDKYSPGHFLHKKSRQRKFSPKNGWSLPSPSLASWDTPGESSMAAGKCGYSFCIALGFVSCYEQR